MGESPGGAARDARAFKFDTFGLGTKRKGPGSVEPGPFFMRQERSPAPIEFRLGQPALRSELTQHVGQDAAV